MNLQRTIWVSTNLLNEVKEVLDRNKCIYRFKDIGDDLIRVEMYLNFIQIFKLNKEFKKIEAIKF